MRTELGLGSITTHMQIETSYETMQNNVAYETMSITSFNNK